MPFRKRVLYYGLLAALSLLAIEGMARAAYFLAFAEGYGGGWVGADSSTLLIDDKPWRTQHPFYGYTVLRHGYELNVMPPRRGQDDTALIGLFGGSVAEAVTPYFQRALSRYFADKGLTRRPVVAGLGYQGTQQPQQVMTAANILLLGGHFDIIVNLDGYNEITHPVEEYQRGVYPFFPRTWDFLVDLTAEGELLAGRMGLLRQEQAELARSAAVHPLRHTAVYGIVRRYRWESVGLEIVRLNNQLAASQSDYSLTRHGPKGWFAQEGELYPSSAEVWQRSSLLLAELAATAGVEYYHFLQPNQYVPGGKPLTAAELACCYNSGGYRERVYRGGYSDMARLGERLRRRSVNYFDLTMIFKDNRETLYRDDCCHLNERGNELLAAALVERLGPALEQAAAARPGSGLAVAARPTPEGVAEELLIDDYFRVYLRGGNRLVYVREDCDREDIRNPFFLHTMPTGGAALPTNRREPGFENWDFQFERGGGIFDGRCVVERQLPAYSGAIIRTGQYIPGGGKVWEGVYRFEE